MSKRWQVRVRVGLVELVLERIARSAEAAVESVRSVHGAVVVLGVS